MFYSILDHPHTHKRANEMTTFAFSSFSIFTLRCSCYSFYKTSQSLIHFLIFYPKLVGQTIISCNNF